MNPINIESLTVTFPRGPGSKPITAVDNLNLKINQGEVVGFIGPNGAGKTTTIKVLMGFIFQTSGKAEVLGYPAGSVEAKRRIGYLPEVALYYPFMTAFEALTLYARAQKIPSAEAKKIIPELLGKVGLSGREKETMKKFSKGMLQRVGIAQSLLGSPELFILDEVTSGLDPVGRRDIREVFIERKKQGSTIFFSSHELVEVGMLCDRIILVDEGKVLEIHKVPDLMDKMRKYLVTLKGDISILDFPDNVLVESIEDNKHHLTFENKEEYLASLDHITNSGIEIIDTRNVEGSLEEYFVKAIGGKVT